jgi:hypothetical protein
VVLPETALSHKRILHLKPPINFDGDKKLNRGNMTRSCKKCGFFVSTSISSTKDISYCLFLKLGSIEKKDFRRKLKIIDGEENKLANDCEEYINTVDYFK